MIAVLSVSWLLVAFLGAFLAILLSAMFAGMETGMYVLNKVRLELRTASGDKAAQRVSKLLARPQELLGVVLISTNILHYLASTAAVTIFTMADVPNAALLTTLIATPTLFVFAEVMPKNVFRLSAETLVYRRVWLLIAARWLLYRTGLLPLVTAFSRMLVKLWHGRMGGGPAPVEPLQRVRGILAEGHAHGALSVVQSGMADRLTRLAATTVAQVMVELPHVVSIPVDCSRERFIRTLAGHNYSRMPVWSGKPRNIVGLVNIYDVLLDRDPKAAPAEHLRNILELPADTDVGRAIVMLQRARQTMGLVQNAAGQAIGIVTMKDLVEEIVGELQAW